MFGLWCIYGNTQGQIETDPYGQINEVLGGLQDSLGKGSGRKAMKACQKALTELGIDHPEINYNDRKRKEIINGHRTPNSNN